MAFTTAELVAKYTNANLGKAPDAATTLTIDAYATQSQTGGISDTVALNNTLKLVNPTTAVAIESYQFFTGRAPSAAGLSYLVNSVTNTNDLNDAAYAKFNTENRFINFAINLATGAGEGAGAFAASYKDVTVAQAVASAYDKIIGNDVAKAAGYDPAASVANLTRAENIAYLTAFVKANTGLTSATDLDLALKAALIGEILNISVQYSLGSYYGSTAAMVNDLSDGSLSTDNAAGVNILTAYPSAGQVGTTFTLIPGADTVTGTNANDTINALSIKADGSAATTFSSFDSIDGGAGVDTLNIYTTGTENATFPTSGAVKNVEVVNILNAGAAAALADASKYQGIQQLWQVNAAAAVTNLATGVTAGFKDVNANVSVTPTTTSASATVALSGFGEGKNVTFDGSAATSTLSTVNLSGTVVDTDANGTTTAPNVIINAGVDVKTLTVNTGVKSVVTFVKNAASAANVATVDASGSTGGVTFDASAITTITTIKGGSAADTLSIATVTAADVVGTTADETVSALVEGGAGNDAITVNTTGDGLTTINGGVGNDTITHTGHGTGKLVANLGDGNDKFLGAGVVSATDVVDGGAGTDTLRLSVVGSANIGAFSNFEVFDAIGLAKTLDVDILASKNTVTEFVASGDVGAAAVLTNVGAGVGYRVIGDTAIANGLTLTQKTAGALTVTLDIDETGSSAATTASTARDALVTATNATSINAVFDSAFVGDATGAGDNATNLKVSTAAATTLTVVSGGANATNDLDFTSTTSSSGKSILTSVTVSGDRALDLDLTLTGTANASVNASALTGALTFNTADLKAESAGNTFDGGTLTLGTGADVITVTQGATIASFQKGSAEGATAQSGFDVVLLGTTSQAADAAANGTSTVKDGLLTFQGAGPATLADAITIADARVAVDGAAVVFEYLGNSYIFIGNDTTTDTVVKLTGVTGLHGLDEVGTSNALYVF